MPVPRFLSIALLSTAATLGLLIAGSPAIAAATVPPGLAAAGAQAGYRSAAQGAPAVVSPSACVQRADYPHHSVHEPTTMNGVVTTRCSAYVPEISFTAQMWETRWWGWDRIGTKGSVTAFDSRGASANAWDLCKNNWVRVTGTGFVLDVDGKRYYASTESIHVKNPCGL